MENAELQDFFSVRSIGGLEVFAVASESVHLADGPPRLHELLLSGLNDRSAHYYRLGQPPPKVGKLLLHTNTTQAGEIFPTQGVEL